MNIATVKQTREYILSGNDLCVSKLGQKTIFTCDRYLTILDKFTVLESLSSGGLEVYKFDSNGFPIYRKRMRVISGGAGVKRKRTKA